MILQRRFMEVTQENFDWYKDLIVKEAFSAVDPKTVTDDMVKAVLAKGWLDVKSAKRILCLRCGSKLHTTAEKLKIENECPMCYVTFTV